MEPTAKGNERVFLGILGAFLGSLVGVACIVLMGQLGYVASVSGLVMAICGVKGYVLLGRKLSKTGILATCIILVVMTYFGHKLDIAFTVASEADINILYAFQIVTEAIQKQIVDPVEYWLSLGVLYLFTLLGAVPVMMHYLREQNMPVMPQNPTKTLEETPDTQSLTIYSANRAWTRPYFILHFAALIFNLLLFLAVIILAATQENFSYVILLLGAMVGLFLMLIPLFSQIKTIQSVYTVYVRANQTLWRVSLDALNRLDTYRFTNRTQLTAVRWDKLSPAEQEAARQSIQRAVTLLSSGQLFNPGRLGTVVLPLTNLTLVKETPYVWVTRYQGADGKSKKCRIPKTYPDLAPTPDAEPQNRPTPIHWVSYSAAFLVIPLCLALVTGGLALHHVITQKVDTLDPASPDSTTSYTLSNVTYEVDSSFLELSPDTYVDGDTETYYFVVITEGADSSMALDLQLELIGEYRMDPNFDRFQFEYAREESDFVPLVGADGTQYQMNLMSIFLKDGTLHSAVALSNDGLMVQIVAVQSTGKEKDVKANMLFMLESLRRNATQSSTV